MSDTSTTECVYRVSTTYDRAVTVLATSFDDARIAGESRVVALLRVCGPGAFRP